MKTDVKKLDGTKREINVSVTGEAVKNKFEDVFAQVAKEAKVAGFRPGKAPRELLEKHYGSAVHEQVLKELVPDVYNEAVKQEGLDVIELPQISQVALDRNSLSFKAVVEVAPEFEVRNYKGRKITFKKISVGGDEIKRQLDAVKQARKAESLDDKFARSLGYPSLSSLEKSLEAQILVNKENQERQRIEKEFADGIMKELDFKLPAGLVKRQLEDMLRQAKIELAMKGVPRDKIEDEEKAIAAELEPQARRQVKLYLILAQIARKESIPEDEHMPAKVMEFLLGQAQWEEAS